MNRGSSGFYFSRVHFNPFTPKFKKYILPFFPKEKGKRDKVVRIGCIFIFHPSKLWKTKFFRLCEVRYLARLQGKV